MSYATVDDLKRQLGISGTTVDVDLLQWSLDAAQDAIDDYCGRSFVVPAEDAEATARVYRANRGRLYVDDFVTLGAVDTSTDMVTWTTVPAARYFAGALNAEADSLPFTWLEPLAGDVWCGGFVRVTAVWGVPSFPPAVKMATLLKAAKLFKRKDSPNGIEGGNADFGAVYVARREDGDICMLLARLRRMDRVAGVA